MTLQKFLQNLTLSTNERGSQGIAGYIDEILTLFESEAYILHWNRDPAQALVILKVNASATDQFKAWLHASCIQARVRTSYALVSSDRTDSDQLALLHETLSEMRVLCKRWLPVLRAQGWDLEATNLEYGQSWRLNVEHS